MPSHDHNALHSLVLTLRAAAPVTVAATMGHQAHAAFLTTIAEVDPDLAQALHAAGARVRPFTVSPLMGVPRPKDQRVALSPGALYRLRFTLLRGDLYERFMARFLAGGRPLVRLGRAELLVEEVLATPGSDPWAGYTSWAELVEAPPQPEVTLAFTTPTAFSFGQMPWGKKAVVLPDPALVFGSLVRSWNALAPAPLQLGRQALREYLEAHAVVKRLSGLRTRMLQFQRAPQIGFLGRVTYGFMEGDNAMRRQLNALAAFAFYAGVGMKTTMGMGQCRPIVLQERGHVN